MQDVACEDLEKSFHYGAFQKKIPKALLDPSDRTNRDQIGQSLKFPTEINRTMMCVLYLISEVANVILPFTRRRSTLPAHKTKASGNKNLHGSSPDSPFQVKKQGSEFITPASSEASALDNEARGQSSPGFSAQVVGS